MTQEYQFTVEPEHQGKRLDKFLSEKMRDLSRAILQKLIKDKKILLNKKQTKASVKLKTGDTIDVLSLGAETELIPDPDVKFGIIHDENDFAVIDKPAGLVVYPAIGHKEKTLVNGLLAKWPEIKNVGTEPLRPGIVHRLDKDTSGLMIIAKNKKAFEYFIHLFKERKVNKTYLALVYGIIESKKGLIDFDIRRSKTNPVKQVAIKEKTIRDSGRIALTRYEAIKYFTDDKGNKYSLVEASPETGRMHQIRVHLAAIGHSIVGDKIYSCKKTNLHAYSGSHFLHAKKISFISPGGKNLTFSSEIPDELNNFLKTLKEFDSQP